MNVKQYIGNTLNFKAHIRENQWQGLLKESFKSKVNAGIICWFIDWDITIFIPIRVLEKMKNKGYKSFNVIKDINKCEKVYIDGEKKKVFFEYNLQKFLEELSYE